MNWNLDDIPAFIAVVERKGFSAAADRLGVSKSTVSKALVRLEAALDMRLVERNSRNIRITEAGKTFYRQCVLIMDQVGETNQVMSGLMSEPSGKLVVALPIAFSREFVAKHLETFRQRFPRVELEVIITAQTPDIIRDQIDLAVVVGSLNDSELVVRTLYESRLVWISSPEYVQTHTFTTQVQNLREHIFVCEKRYGQSRFGIRLEDRRQFIDLSRNIIHINDPISVREAVINGCGVSMLADQYCRQQIKTGELVQVYEDVQFDAPAAKLSAIYPSRRFLSNKTRAFLDFLVEISHTI